MIRNYCCINTYHILFIKESVSDQDTDEDISMEEDIQMDEADEK